MKRLMAAVILLILLAVPVGSFDFASTSAPATTSSASGPATTRSIRIVQTPGADYRIFTNEIDGGGQGTEHTYVTAVGNYTFSASNQMSYTNLEGYTTVNSSTWAVKSDGSFLRPGLSNVTTSRLAYVVNTTMLSGQIIRGYLSVRYNFTITPTTSMSISASFKNLTNAQFRLVWVVTPTADHYLTTSPLNQATDIDSEQGLVSLGNVTRGFLGNHNGASGWTTLNFGDFGMADLRYGKIDFGAGRAASAVAVIFPPDKSNIDPSLVTNGICEISDVANGICGLPGNVTSGDGLILLATGSNGSSITPSVQDTVLNSWNEVSGHPFYPAASPSVLDAWYVPSSEPGPFWANYSTGGPTEASLWLLPIEISGAINFDSGSTGQESSSTTSVAPFAPAAGDFVIGNFYSSPIVGCTDPAGFTDFTRVSCSGPIFGAVAYNSDWGGGSTAISWSLSASADWGEQGLAFTSSTIIQVSQPVTATLGGSSGSNQNVTVTACLAGPSKFMGDGAAHSIALDPDCNATLTLPVDYIWQGTNSHQTVVQACSSGACPGVSLTYTYSKAGFAILHKPDWPNLCNSASCTVGLFTPVSAGEYIIIEGTVFDSCPRFSASDSLSTSYTVQVTSPCYGSEMANTLVAGRPEASGADTITLSTGLGSGGQMDTGVFVVSGLNSATANGTASAVFNGVSSPIGTSSPNTVPTSYFAVSADGWYSGSASLAPDTASGWSTANCVFPVGLSSISWASSGLSSPTSYEWDGSTAPCSGTPEFASFSGTEVGAVWAGPPPVTQPIAASIVGGGSDQNVTTSGCSASPALFAGDGVAHNVTARGSCAMTLTLPAGYDWLTSNSTSTTVATCQTGVCPGIALQYVVAVTQPIEATLSGPGTTQIVTAHGCSSGPQTFAGNGTAHTVSMIPSCSFSFSLPLGYQFSSPSTGTSCTTGTCQVFSATYVQQTTITQPLFCTMSDDTAPVANLTLSGDGVSPASVLCDGVEHDVTALSLGTITISVALDGSTSRYRLLDDAASMSVSTCSSGTCSEFAFGAYYQYSESVAYTVQCATGATCSPPTLSYTHNGSSVQLALSTMTQTFWADSSTIISVSTAITDSLGNSYTPALSSWLTSSSNVVNSPVEYWEGI